MKVSPPEACLLVGFYLNHCVGLNYSNFLIKMSDVIVMTMILSVRLNKGCWFLPCSRKTENERGEEEMVPADLLLKPERQ